MFINIIGRIRGEKRRERVRTEVEELKKALLEDPQFRDEILRELEYMTGRRDLLKAGVLGLLGLAVGGGVGGTVSATNNSDVITESANSINPYISSKCVDALVWMDRNGNVYAENKNGLIDSGTDAAKIIQQVIDSEDNNNIFIKGKVLVNRKIILKPGKILFGFGKYLYSSNTIYGSVLYGNFSGELIECQKGSAILGLSLINKNENGDAIKITDMHVKIGLNDIFSKRYGILAKYERLTYHPYTRPEAFIFNNRITGEGLRGSVGIWCFNITDVEIKDNIIRGFETGIRLDKGGNRVTGNHIYKYPANSYARAIHITHSRQQVTNNQFDSPNNEGILIEGDIDNVIIKDNFMKIESTGVGIRVVRTTPGWMVRTILEGNIIITNSNPNPAVKLENVTKISSGSRIINAVYGFNKGSNNTIQTGTAVIPKGKTAVTVTHNLPIVNPLPIISVTGDNEETQSYWITNITETKFTINVPKPVTADRTVRWRAEVYAN